MYLSHPVRRMCDDPLEGEEVSLVVESASEDDSLGELESRIEDVGGTVDDRLPFDTLRVTLPEERVAALCELDGIESVGTDGTIGIGGDPNEDM